MKKIRIRMRNILIWWAAFLVIAFLIVFLLNPSVKAKIIAFCIAIPVSFAISVVLYLLCIAFYSRKFITINKLTNNFGAGEKCAEELSVLSIGEKNVEMKNIYVISLAKVYMEMGEPEEVLKTLERINRHELFRFSFNPLHKKLECDYYYLKMSAYDSLDDKDNVVLAYKQGRRLFGRFYNKQDEPLINLTIQYNIESCLENYEKCQSILNEFFAVDNDQVKATASLCSADIYIKTGRIEEAAVLLKDIKHNIYGLANAKEYEKLCNKIKELQNTQEVIEEF